MAFEMARKNHEGAKRVFFRAIKDVPWSKKLWMDCISLREKGLSETETNALVELMAEKELRVRYNLDGGNDFSLLYHFLLKFN